MEVEEGQISTRDVGGALVDGSEDVAVLPSSRPQRAHQNKEGSSNCQNQSFPAQIIADWLVMALTDWPGTFDFRGGLGARYCSAPAPTLWGTEADSV